jgi:hypothetical protein
VQKEMQMSDETKELRRTIAALAALLIEYAGDDVEKMPPLEGDEDAVVFVHAKGCHSLCEWGCGAVGITYSTSNTEEAEITIERVDVGATVVRGLSGDV